MGQQKQISCPQCAHINLITSPNCGLCDWPLALSSFDETKVLDTNDPNLTLAPGMTPVENHQTQQHASNSTYNSPRTTAEKQTFHLAGDLAHFEVHEILGRGGMGAVYHAKDRILKRDVALKMLRPLAASNLQQDALLEEARMASQLNHPNIVTIYDVARAKDSNYIVMEWVDGQGLDELIPGHGLELIQAIEYASQIADGLSFAHQKYIVHRDIKPQNIMLSSQNSIKILDFGIAGLMNQDSHEDTNKQSPTINAITGTPNYMSPEQIQGLNLDQRSDIFSFGIVLYEMLTGKRPFQGLDVETIHQAIKAGDYCPILKLLPDLPIHIAKLVEKMLATHREERWQSSAELAAEIHAIYNQLTYKKNWWQRRGFISKAAIILPFILVIGFSAKEIIFPASTQQLIERQLKEATKIAILPFENISGDPLIQLFSDGLAVNLGSDLSAIASELGNTWIVPSTEISRMKDPTPKDVTDKYGVNLILTGSIQHMGSTRLMALNLLDASNGQLLKTTEVEIDAEQLFQGHAKVRQEALSLLDWKIPDSLKTKFEAQRPQLDGAYKEYIKGIGYFYRYDQPDNLNKAEDAFKDAIELSPEYTLAFIGLAETQLIKFRQTKNNKWLFEMEKTINSLSKISTESCQVDYLKAELLTRKGEYQQAINLFKNCLKENSKHIPSYLGLANAHSKNGEIGAAERYYEKAIEISPNNVKSIIDYGIFHYYNGNYIKAIDQSNALASIAPNNVNAYIYLAGNYYALGKIDEAIQNTLYAIDLKPTDSGYSNLATMYYSKKEYDKAVSAYEQAINLNPTYYIFWGNLADAYKILDNINTNDAYLKAIELAYESLKTNPKDSTVIADLAYYLANVGEITQSLTFANKIGINNTGEENFMVATAYDVLNKPQLAIEHLKIAISKNYSMEEIRNTPLLKNTKADAKFEQLINRNSPE
jgi:serine/threonine-protein kinase